MASTDRPSFTGLSVYRNLRHRFSLLYPDGWAQAPAPKDVGGGVVISPDADDRHTSVLVQGRRLPSKVEPDDLDTLRGGLLEGVQQLPDAHVQEEKSNAAGKLIDAEVKHTYRDVETGEVRKRWVRVLCQERVQVSIVAQGSSEARFEYWLPMFNTIMRTVKFADWWADSTGHSWQKRVDQPPD